MDRIAKLKEYLRVNHQDSFLQHALALEYIKIGNEAEARDLFNTILRREPTYINSYCPLGKLYERIADPAKAMRIYQRGMEEAKKADDSASYNELQTAMEDLTE